MKKNQGFGLIEGLLILLIIGILAGVGWFVWQSKKNTDKNLNSAAQTEIKAGSSKKATATVEKDPTADWVAYSNKEGSFSLKHPKTWVKASNPELCNPGLLLIGADENSVGKCATESFGQMSVSSAEGNYTAEQALASGYTDVTQETVTVEGVSGTKYSGSASGQMLGEGPGGLADGTKVTKYVFYTNSRTYTATYIKASSYPDALSDFNLMVTKTLKFSS